MNRARELLREAAVALLGDGREERLLVREVPVRRAVRDPDRRGHLAQREPFRAVLGDDLERGRDERPREIAVVIGALLRARLLRW